MALKYVRPASNAPLTNATGVLRFPAAFLGPGRPQGCASPIHGPSRASQGLPRPLHRRKPPRQVQVCPVHPRTPQLAPKRSHHSPPSPPSLSRLPNRGQTPPPSRRRSQTTPQQPPPHHHRARFTSPSTPRYGAPLDESPLALRTRALRPTGWTPPGLRSLANHFAGCSGLSGLDAPPSAYAVRPQ